MSELEREQVRRWLAETEGDNESILGVSDDEEEIDFVEEWPESEDDSELEESEQEERRVETEQPDMLQREFYIGKDRTSRWYNEPLEPRTSRTSRHNIIPLLHRPGPRGEAKNANSHLKAIECFLDTDIIQKIVASTNIYIDKIKQNYQRDRDAKATDEIEIKALIGILYLLGVLHDGRRNVMSMWDISNGTGVDACYVTISEHRFRFLLRCLRFDNLNDRLARRELDKMAPIREIFEHFVQKCKEMYKPSDYLTLDEQLVAFRGRCPFRQYMPKKPARYGIKVFALTSANNYTTNLEVYLGVQPDGPYKVSNACKDVVLRLVEPVSGTNRNITADNWFSSVPIAKELFKNKSLTFIGTLKKNKPEVPLCFLPDKDREVNTTLFGFQENLSLVSYVPNKNKAVLMISSMHSTKAIDENTGEAQKPAVITSYNDTKFGVDILDKMCKQYDASRNSRRWPLTLFFHIMNVAGVNALIVYKANNNNAMLNRSEFLLTLAMDLIKPQIQRRINMQMIPKEIKHRGRLLLKIEEAPVNAPPAVHGGIGRCHLCGRARNKSTRKRCYQCTKWVCPDHQASICNECVTDD